MSTDREFVDDRHDAPDDPDPYDIVPNDFIANWGGPEVTTIAGALRVAEQAPSTTPRSEMKRCPAKGCGSVKIRYKPGEEQSNSREGIYQCVSCKSHFTTPLPSLNDARRDADHAPETDREAEKPRCPGCESVSLYPVPERAAPDSLWICRDCGDRFDEAAPSQIDKVRARAQRRRQRDREPIGEMHEQAALDEVSRDD